MTKQLTERLHLDRLPPEIRNALDSWRFWFTMGAVAIGCLVIWAVINTVEITSTQAQQARDDAVKAAQIQASAQSAYSSCVGSRPELQRLSTFVGGVNMLSSTLVHDSEATLKVTPRTDPGYVTRSQNLARIEHAARKVHAIHALPVPTLADCKAREIAILVQASK